MFTFWPRPLPVGSLCPAQLISFLLVLSSIGAAARVRTATAQIVQWDVNRTQLQPPPAACQPPHHSYPFCNSSLGLDERLADLIGRINDSDKPGLLTARGLQPLPELGVPPYYWGTNCLHSVGAPCTAGGRCPTNFPSGPSVAATFNTRLISAIANVIGRELNALYNLGVNKPGLDCWGPVINLNRDPRWGRIGEGGAEDPFLLAKVAEAWVDGFQFGGNSSRAVLQAVLTLKHFVANSLENTLVQHNQTVDGFHYVANSTVSRHNINVDVSPYQLQETYLPAFRAAVRAGALGLMCSYNSVRGIPTCLSPLMRKLRELWTGTVPWGGYITSDSDSVSDAVHSHHFTDDPRNASCMAIRDGGDDVDSGDTYSQYLLPGVASGLCSMRDVDKALYNTLRLRFKLGLFDPADQQPLRSLGEQDVATEYAKQLNMNATAESLVLLKNDGVLPLKPGKRIAVIGPHSNASRFLLQVDTGGVCGGDGTFDCVESPFSAIKALNRGGETKLAVGCDVINETISTKALRSAAIATAQAADIVILAIGIGQCGCMGIADSYMGGKRANPGGCATSTVPPYDNWDNCWNHQEVPAGQYIGAEQHDRIKIDLPAVQRDFARAIFALKKPTVVLLLNGGSVDVAPELAASNGFIEAFYPGTSGSTAIAEALFGRTNKFGRMPYTMYQASFADRNPMMEHDLARGDGRTHKFYRGVPVVPFGAGLSYSSYELQLLSPSKIITSTALAGQVVRATISNTGGIPSDAVLMLFLMPVTLTQQVGSKLVQKLIWFDRVNDMAPGQSVNVSVPLTADTLALTDLATGDIVSTPGTFKLRLTHNTASGGNGDLTIDLQVHGEQRILEKFPRID